MRITRKAIGPLLFGLAVLVSACGDNDNASESKDNPRTVTIEMVDNDFRSEPLEFKRGETIRFVFNNRGTVAHDAFIGDTQAQAAHGARMGEEMGGNMGGNMGKSTSEGITVPPGANRELMHTFDKSGSLEIGCHQPGHYESGMKTRVMVS